MFTMLRVPVGENFKILYSLCGKFQVDTIFEELFHKKWNN